MGFTWISGVLEDDALSLLLAENIFSSLGKEHTYIYTHICMCFFMWKKSKFELK